LVENWINGILNQSLKMICVVESYERFLPIHDEMKGSEETIATSPFTALGVIQYSRFLDGGDVLGREPLQALLDF
jgi:hypothetical protein